MDLTIPIFLVVYNTIGLGKYSIIRVTNMALAPLLAQLHSLGTRDFGQFGGVRDTRSLNQLNYNKTNGATQTRKIKQE